MNDSPLKCLLELSIVVPVYNEAETLHSFFQRLEAVLTSLDVVYEVIFVNDGSTDATLAVLRELRKHCAALRIIDLSRNFGKEVALSAGLDYAEGAAVIPIDADLQDPPELIPELLAQWRAGYDVVYATRRARKGETWMKRGTAHVFYRLLSYMSDTQVPRDTGDFRLMDRRVVIALRDLPERTRFMKGLFAWVGFKQTAVYFERPPRQAGNSKISYLKLWNLALDGIISFSSFPLRVWSYIGLFFALSAMLYAAFIVLRTLIIGIELPGYASLMTVILFIGGVQLIGLGVIGEYLGRVYTEVKHRPLYLVRRTWGLSDRERTEYEQE